MLYNVRFEIASSEIMESSMGDLEMRILGEFSRDDRNDTKIINVK